MLLNRNALMLDEHDMQFYTDFKALSDEERAARSLAEQAWFTTLERALEELERFDAMNPSRQKEFLAERSLLLDRMTSEALGFIGMLRARQGKEGTELEMEDGPND